MDYQESGVDLERAAGLAGIFAAASAESDSKQISADRGGGFCALHKLPGYDRLLAAAADGIGSKALLHSRYGTHRAAGIDLVAMNVNDLATVGAVPFFFHDYISMQRLEKKTVTELVAGMSEACRMCGCALTGGESAELPGMAPAGGYELAGFATGLVAPEQLLGPDRVTCGDLVVGLFSSGVHANGFTLIRALLQQNGRDPEQIKVDGEPLHKLLLRPTVLYSPAVQVAVTAGGCQVHSAAHITGGGLMENIPRALPENCDAVIDPETWKISPVFEWIAGDGAVTQSEMRRVFNLGIGFVLIIAPRVVDSLTEALHDAGYESAVIGNVVEGSGEVIFSSGMMQQR